MSGNNKGWFARQAERTAEDIKQLPDWLRTMPDSPSPPSVSAQAVAEQIKAEAFERDRRAKVDNFGWFYSGVAKQIIAAALSAQATEIAQLKAARAKAVHDLNNAMTAFPEAIVMLEPIRDRLMKETS